MQTNTNKTLDHYLSIRTKLVLIVLCDFISIFSAWFGSYWLYYNLVFEVPAFLQQAVLGFPLIFIIQIAFYQYFGIYRSSWRYTSITDLVRIAKFILSGFATIILVNYFLAWHFAPRSIYPLYVLLLFTFIAGPRMAFRAFIEQRKFAKSSERLLVIGAGQAGEAFVRNLIRDSHQNLEAVAFIDDDPNLSGKEIHGVRVVGTSGDIARIVTEYKIQLVVIAISSLAGSQLRKLVEKCEKLNIPFRKLPSLEDIIAGKININSLKKISIEDLLGREQVSLDWELIRDQLNQKTVLVTGGCGSIGSELCRQIMMLKPKKLIIADNNEYRLYLLDKEIEQKFPEVNRVACLLDITDEIGVNLVFKEQAPDIIFHAAAYKHVPLLQEQARVAVRNNILGTKIIAKAAHDNSVSNFVLISTDKAVNPTNIMGATKYLAEKICLDFAQLSQTKFITVRFGNVLNSAGSVVPLFREQLSQGGPLTVTHPEITRYFMSIPEAARLILQAAVMGKGGELFVLDMGEPIKIRYLAEQMISLAGYSKDEIEIQYIGLRPGEKLHEELVYEVEHLEGTEHQKIMKVSKRTGNISLDKNLLKLIKDNELSTEKNQISKYF